MHVRNRVGFPAPSGAITAVTLVSGMKVDTSRTNGPWGPSMQTCSKAKRAPAMASVSHHRDPIVILGA